MDTVFAQIRTITTKKKLYVTGHSLGGALAMLYAFRCEGLSHTVAITAQASAVVTFGQPRVGDAAFARDYDARLGDVTLRVVHECDIVPRVPVHWLLSLYRHAGHSLFLDAIGAAHLDMPAWMRLPSDILDLWRIWLRFKIRDWKGLSEEANYHSMIDYAKYNYTPGSKAHALDPGTA